MSTSLSFYFFHVLYVINLCFNRGKATLLMFFSYNRSAIVHISSIFYKKNIIVSWLQKYIKYFHAYIIKKVHQT